MTIYFEQWQETECGCEGCSWKGTAGTAARGRLHRGLYLELYCPECSNLVDIIIYPVEQGCAKSREELTDEQRQARDEAEENERLYRSQCLRAADQLPDLPDGDLNLVWDQLEGETLVLNGETVIWREPVAYEAFERFERIARILKDRYGDRVKDLSPTDRSLLFLYGDYYPSMDYLRKVRKELFDVSEPG